MHIQFDVAKAPRDDGGPAFPQHVAPAFRQEPEIWGMSLRDWYAGQQLMRIASGWPNEDNMGLIAKNCFAMADAMLAERKK